MSIYNVRTMSIQFIHRSKIHWLPLYDKIRTWDNVQMSIIEGNFFNTILEPTLFFDKLVVLC
jgi:hypothetical protein